MVDRIGQVQHAFAVGHLEGGVPGAVPGAERARTPGSTSPPSGNVARTPASRSAPRMRVPTVSRRCSAVRHQSSSYSATCTGVEGNAGTSGSGQVPATVAAGMVEVEVREHDVGDLLGRDAAALERSAQAVAAGPEHVAGLPAARRVDQDAAVAAPECGRTGVITSRRTWSERLTGELDRAAVEQLDGPAAVAAASLADAGDGVLPPDELGAVAQLHGLGRDHEHDVAGLEVADLRSDGERRWSARGALRSSSPAAGFGRSPLPPSTAGPAPSRRAARRADGGWRRAIRGGRRSCGTRIRT